MPIPPLLVGHRSWNGQFHFSARTHLTPETQVRTDALCPLAHPRYAKVAGLSAGQYLGVDPSAIVTHTQTKLILIVPDFDLNEAGSGVCEGVPDHLARYPIDFVLKHRGQSSFLTFDEHAKAGRVLVKLLSCCQFVTRRLEQLGKVTLRGLFRAQVVYGNTALSNALLRGLNRIIYHLHGVVRFKEKQSTRSLKLENCSLKAL
jgi:hypothetical protein